MKKEELLNSDFLKQFTTGEELFAFAKELQKRGVEQLLEGELDAHLGYTKNAVFEGENARNGHTTKIIKTTDGEFLIDVPRDRKSTFEPILVPKRKTLGVQGDNHIFNTFDNGFAFGY